MFNNIQSMIIIVLRYDTLTIEVSLIQSIKLFLEELFSNRNPKRCLTNFSWWEELVLGGAGMDYYAHSADSLDPHHQDLSELGE